MLLRKIDGRKKLNAITNTMTKLEQKCCNQFSVTLETEARARIFF